MTIKTDEKGNAVYYPEFKRMKSPKEDKIEFFCASCKSEVTQDIKPLTTSDKIFYNVGEYSIPCPHCDKSVFILKVDKGTYTLINKIKI